MLAGYRKRWDEVERTLQEAQAVAKEDRAGLLAEMKSSGVSKAEIKGMKLASKLGFMPEDKRAEHEEAHAIKDQLCEQMKLAL